MQDFDRTLELVDISQDSAGATMAQHTQFMKGMEAATTNLRTAYQNFITAITDSELLIGIIRGMSTALNGLTAALKGIGIEGSVAMGILASLFVAMKFGNNIMAIFNNFGLKGKAILAAKNQLTAAEAVLTKKKSKLQAVENNLEAKKLAYAPLDKRFAEAKALNQKILLKQQKQAITLTEVQKAQAEVEQQQKNLEILQEGKLIKLKGLKNSQLVKGNIFTMIYEKILKKSVVTVIAKVKALKAYTIAQKQAMVANGGFIKSLFLMIKTIITKGIPAVLKFALAIFTTPIG
jgi:hypothetical protein